MFWKIHEVKSVQETRSKSVILSLIIGQIIARIYKKRKNAINLNLKEQEKMADISLQFLLEDSKNIMKFYSILLSVNHAITQTKNSIRWENCAFVPFYENTTITSDTVAKIFKDNKIANNIFIAGISFSEDAVKLASKIKQCKITLLDESQIFNILKKYDFYPDFKIELNKKEKFKYSRLKEIAFTKTNAKHYLISGFIILLTSFFIKYNIYYLLCW